MAPEHHEAMRPKVSGIPDASDPLWKGDLSAREKETLTYLSHGLTIAQAAQVMGIAFETARSHKRHACLKLGAKNTAHAIARAMRAGLIA